MSYLLKSIEYRVRESPRVAIQRYLRVMSLTDLCTLRTETAIHLTMLASR